MARRLNIEFANFVCKFGNKNLLDLAEQVILPAFRSNSERRYAAARYFFHEVEVLTLDDKKEVLCIAGRLVKETKLTREQVYDEKQGLVKDSKAIESAPSSLFALILNDHKLLYVHETAHAPDLVSFKATASYAIMTRHKVFVEETFKYRKEHDLTGERITKKEILKEYPFPSVDIIPLSSKASLEDFVGQYRKLKIVEAKLIETNAEIDLNGLFRDVRGSMNEIGSKSTIIRHQNSEGLNAESAILQLNAAAGQGNTYIKLDGEDINGDTLKGDNHKFKLRIPITEISNKIRTASKDMYDAFLGVKDSGILHVTDQDEESNEKVKFLLEKGIANEQ
jgi:hypothetical protein